MGDGLTARPMFNYFTPPMSSAANMPEIYFAYCRRDGELVEHLLPRLTTLGITSLPLERSASSTPLVESVPSAANLLLLITKHFLLDADCCYRLDELLSGSGRIALIEQAHGEAQLTHDNRLHSLVAQWQQRYLQLRGDLLHYEGDALEDFRVHLHRVREISLALPATFDVLTVKPTALLTDIISDPKCLPGLLERTGLSLSPMHMEQSSTEGRSAEDLLIHAWALCEAGDTEEGLEVLSRAADATPARADLGFQYALMLALESGDLIAARARLDTLLDNHPNHHDALFLSGELYEGTGQVAGARVQWDRLSDLNPNYPKLDERLANLIQHHFPENFPEAEAHFRKAVKLAGTEASTHLAYARLLAGPLGKKRKARKQLRVAIAKDPTSGIAHYQLAVLEYGAGKRTRARKNYLLATTLEPTFDTPTNRQAFYGNEALPAAQSEPQQNLSARIAELEQELAQSKLVNVGIDQPTGKPLTVLISGATSGIGRATASLLGFAGYRLIVLGRRMDRLDALIAEFSGKPGSEIHAVQLDVRNRGKVFSAIESLPDEWKEIDVLINNAGKAKGFDPIQRGDPDHWDEMIDVNLKGLLYLTRAVTPGMVERGRGMIINVASTAGKEVYPKGNVYCATKHAVDALTYAMRLDLVSHGIRVGQICPAHVEETEFAVVRFDGNRERARIYEDFQPLRSPDVAAAIRFMIEQPAHVNVMDMTIQGTQQASSTVIDRSGRRKFSAKE